MKGENTLKQYKRILKEFIFFIANREGEVFTERKIIKYLNIKNIFKFLEYETMNKKLTKKTICTYFSGLNYFLPYENKINIYKLKQQDFYINAVNSPVIRKAMNEKEVERILSRLNIPLSSISHKTLKNFVIIRILLHTGARISEVAKLKKEDIKINDNFISIYFKNTKTNQDRKVEIKLTDHKGLKIQENIRFKRILKKYLNSIKKIKSPYLFTGKNLNNHLSIRQMQRIVKKFLVETGLDEFSAHSFRHTFATLTLKKSSPASVAKMLGHRSPYVTMTIYNDMILAEFPSLFEHNFNRT